MVFTLRISLVIAVAIVLMQNDIAVAEESDSTDYIGLRTLSRELALGSAVENDGLAAVAAADDDTLKPALLQPSKIEQSVSQNAFLSITANGNATVEASAGDKPNANDKQDSGAEAKSDEALKSTEASEIKQLALLWLDEFAMFQALFEHEHVAKFRRRMVTMNDDEIETWLIESVPLRARLAEPRWQAVNEWLRQFWTVQGMYDASEIDAFRQQLTELTPQQMFLVLDHFETAVESKMRSRQFARHNERLLARQQNLRSRPLLRPTNAYAPMSGRSANVPRREPRRLQQRSISQQVSDLYIFRSLYFPVFSRQ